MIRKNFCDDDKLEREGYAEFIKILLSDTSKYKRDKDTSSFVLAIDSPWGTGKTYFVEMMHEYLEKSACGMQFNIFRYNAWKNDFWNNAFEPLMYAILYDDKGNRFEAVNALEDKLKECLPTIAKIIGKGLLKQAVGEDAAKDIVEGIGSLVGLDKIFSEYKGFRDSLELLKKALEDYVDRIGKNRKLVIIIDELDRCKPTFAIQTLEIAKHLFDVEGISFVFALDMQQLSHSIKCVYGSDMDATGYLMRFFDYVFRMPSPDSKSFIEYTVNESSLKLSNPDEVKFIDNFDKVARGLNLSLRDINTIYTNFLALKEFEFSNIQNVELYNNYLSLLCIKYSNPLYFGAIISGKSSDIKYKNFPKLLFGNNLLSYVESSNTIAKTKFIWKRYNSTAEFYISRYENGNFYVANNHNEPSNTTHEFYPDDVLNGIITYKDLQVWNKIKNLRVHEFIHHKLEMFDFSYDKVELQAEELTV